MELWSELTCNWVGMLSFLITAFSVGMAGCFIYWFVGKFGPPPEA